MEKVKKIIKKCPICKIKFKVYPSLNRIICCSKKCSYLKRIIENDGKAFNYGFKLTDKQKEFISQQTKKAMKKPKIIKKISKTWIKKGEHISPKTEFQKEIIPFSKLHPEIMPRGNKHHNWRGGIAELPSMIRQLDEYKIWKKDVFKKNNYTCQDCGKYGGDLEAHHIKPFVEIYQEFLNKYNQFSPIEDKETLVRLAITWQPFWEVSNGKTLCVDCHNLTKKGILT